MTIRPATEEDFNQVLHGEDFTYFSWDFIQDAAKALKAGNISLHIQRGNNNYIVPLVKKKVLGIYPVALGMPFGLYGGIAPQNGMDETIFTDLIAGVHAYLKMDMIVQNVFQEEILAKSGLSRIKKAFTHLVFSKNQNYGEYFQAAFSQRMKRGVKTAGKNNVDVAVGNSPELIEDFYKLYKSSNVRWGKKKPRYGINFFRHFSNKSYFEIRISYFQGRPAGGLAMLKFNNYYFDWFAGMDHELRHSKANTYLYADLIKESIEKNYSVINFGASAGLPGVQEFKESFGAKKHEYHLYFYGNPVAREALRLMMRFFY